MTDYELNMMVARQLYPDAKFIERHGLKGSKLRLVTKVNIEICPDYCNNWNDLMPLVIANDISYFEGSACYGFDDGFESGYPHPDTYQRPSWDIEITNDNDQRALAECLLKVLQNKEGK